MDIEDIDVMLCEHAEVADNKLFINGAGINLFWVGTAPPHVITFSLAAVVHVPYTATNQQHTLVATLVTQDGEQVHPALPAGMDSPGPIRVEAAFNVGRPPLLLVGESQPMPLAFTLQGLPLSELGSFSVVLEIDGQEVRRLPFRLVVKPQQGGFGGPAAIPPLG
jgi:hypothetical protein